MRAAIALGLTLPAMVLLGTGMKLNNPYLKSAGMWVGGFANGYMATDAFYQWGRSREEG
jgi:hypothetical protein